MGIAPRRKNTITEAAAVTEIAENVAVEIRHEVLATASANVIITETLVMTARYLLLTGISCHNQNLSTVQFNIKMQQPPPELLLFVSLPPEPLLSVQFLPAFFHCFLNKCP